MFLEKTNKIDKNHLRIHQEKEKKTQTANTNIQWSIVTIDSTDLSKIIKGYCEPSLLINLAIYMKQKIPKKMRENIYTSYIWLESRIYKEFPPLINKKKNNLSLNTHTKFKNHKIRLVNGQYTWKIAQHHLSPWKFKLW